MTKIFRQPLSYLVYIIDKAVQAIWAKGGNSHLTLVFSYQTLVGQLLQTFPPFWKSDQEHCKHSKIKILSSISISSPKINQQNKPLRKLSLPGPRAQEAHIRIPSAFTNHRISYVRDNFAINGLFGNNLHHVKFGKSNHYIQKKVTEKFLSPSFVICLYPSIW